VLSSLDDDSLQAIMITELDTKTWSVKGWNVISSPDQAWEKNTTNSGSPNSIVAVNEGPHVSLSFFFVQVQFSTATRRMQTFAFFSVLLTDFAFFLATLSQL